MIEAKLEITAEGYYSCDITRKIPVRVDLISINGPLGFGIIQSLSGEEKPLIDYVKSLKKSSSIAEVRVTYKTPEQYWTEVTHKLRRKSIHQTILESGCMSRLPIVIEGGTQIHHILAPDTSAFRLAFDNLRSRFAKVRVLSVRRSPRGTLGLGLTQKQLDAIRLAISNGYYDMPRRSEIEKLAKKLKIKRVAMQERLRRAERTIMNQFAEEYL
ncbi:MAG: helix-turn-helix domain-containing protein [Candidatus Thorarchaeota archaeon]|jgi:predicted DNA binding protein